jgi:hypothetical protein
MRLERIPEPRTEEEQYLYEMIERLRKEYEVAVKPYMDRLIKIEMLRQPKYYLVPEEGDPAPTESVLRSTGARHE